MKGRNRKISAFILLFIVFEIIFTSMCYATDLSLKEKQENTIIVDKNKEGDYTTIQEAITKEPEGTTIYIKNGVYNEILTIKKKIILIGESKENTIIDSISEQNKYSIYLGAPEIVIEKLSIKNSGPGLYTSGIKIVASKTHILDCYIYDTPVGIAVFTSSNIIENCEFYGCTDEGIVLLGTSYSECKDNKIINCKFYNNCDGIELQYSTDNLITNCEFYNNTHTGIDAIVSSNDRNIISNCKIYNNQVHGLYLSSSSNNKIIDCNILDNDNGNIVINKDSQNNEIISESYEGLENKNENNLKVTLSLLLSKRFIRPIIKKISLINNKIMTIF